MIQYVGTQPGATIALHDILRVTFAQNVSGWIPDEIESADLRDNLAHLFREMEAGGFALAAVSDTVVPPGALATSIDFMPAGRGAISVGQALDQLQAGLYGPFDFAQRTYIRRVEKLANIGGAIPQDEISQPDEQMTPFELLSKLSTVLTVAAVVAGVFYFGPELKLALRARAK